MTSSCIRLVWQPIQHKDRQRAESGETDSWVAANRQGGPTNSNPVDTTIFEMWLGNLSTYQGLSIPVA